MTTEQAETEAAERSEAAFGVLTDAAIERSRRRPSNYTMGEDAAPKPDAETKALLKGDPDRFRVS